MSQLQERLRQETQQVRRDLESAHQRSSQQMQSRLAQLETSCGELGDSNFKNQAALRDLKSKLAGAEEVRPPIAAPPAAILTCYARKKKKSVLRMTQECRRLEQQVGSLRRDKDSADAELHAKERLAEQLRARVAALEQEVQDKEWKMSRTQEALTAAQQQQVGGGPPSPPPLLGRRRAASRRPLFVLQGSLKKSADGKEAQLRQLEAQVEFLAADVKKVGDDLRCEEALESRCPLT